MIDRSSGPKMPERRRTNGSIRAVVSSYSFPVAKHWFLYLFPVLALGFGVRSSTVPA